MKLDKKFLATFVDVDTVKVASALLGYLFAWGGIYGFFLDMIMSREIGYRLPLQLQNAARDIMGKLSWTLFDISDFDLNILADKKHALRPAVSRMNDSALLGFAIDG